MADSGGFEIAKAYVTIIPSFKDGQTTISKELGAVTDSASKEAGEKSGKSFGNAMAKGLKATATVIAGAMATVTAGAVAVTKTFVDTAKQTAAYGDEVDKTSQKLGLSAKAYQEWDYVMKIAGTEMSSMTTGLKTLTNKLDDAKNGSASAQAMFSALGISMEDISSMSREDLFKATIQGFQGMADSTERAALANDLFGKSGQNLAPLFNMTADETQGLIEKANDLGMVMSDEGVKGSASFTDAMTTLNGTITGLKNNLMTQFMPSLTEVTEGLAEAFAGKGTAKLTSGIKNIIKQFKSVAPDLFKAVKDIGESLIQGIGPMLPDLVSMLFSLVVSAITTLTAMTPQMMPAITEGLRGIMSAVLSALPVIIQGLTTLLLDLANWLSQGGAQELVNGIISMVATIVNNIALILPPLLVALTTVISEIAKALTEPQNIEMLLDAVLTIIGAIAVAIWQALPVIWDMIVGVLKNLGNLVGDFLYAVVPKVASTLTNVINTVKGWGDNIKNFFVGLWTNLKDGVTKGLDNIKQKFTSVFDNIRNFVKSALDKIRSFFKFEWSLPKIKLPHFSIKGSFSLNPPKVPSFGISWYAKAMNEPFVLNNPTIFGAMNGNLLGGGERGSELVVGVDKLMQMIADAKGSQSITINAYCREGQDIKAFAKEVAYAIEDLKNNKERVYA